MVGKQIGRLHALRGERHVVDRVVAELKDDRRGDIHGIREKTAWRLS